MLQVEIISRLDSDSSSFLDEWSDLASQCPTATVFQTPQWLATWWRIIGRKSRTRRLHLMAARERGKLVGLLPLMLSNWYLLPQQRLSFIGAGVTDYNDAIAASGREEEVCAAFYDYFARECRSRVIDFRELRQGGLLREYPPPKKTGLICSDWPLENCPYIALPQEGSPDERWTRLLRGYSKKMRGNIGYSDRTLRRAYRVEIRKIDEPSELPQAFRELYELHQRRWNQRWLPGVFSHARVRSFHAQAAAELLKHGWLRLYLLQLDEQVQAALYGFAFNDRTCYYQGGFEPELARYSLGSQLIAHAIRVALDEGFTTFDFLRGNEEYKMRWTHDSRKTNVRRLIAASSAQLCFAESVHRLENGIEARLKTVFAGGLVHRAHRQRSAADSS